MLNREMFDGYCQGSDFKIVLMPDYTISNVQAKLNGFCVISNFIDQNSLTKDTNNQIDNPCNDKSDNEPNLSYIQSTKGFLCFECGKSFEKSRQLINHRYHVHSKTIAKHKCEQCNSSFTTLSKLKKHLISHGSPTFKCHKCSKMLKTKFNLSRHLSTCSKN